MTTDRDPKTYDRPGRDEGEATAPMPIAPNTLGAGAGVIVPPAVTPLEEEAEQAAEETADPVKERAQDLPPGQEFKERSLHNWSGEALVSEVQRQSGVGGGRSPHPSGDELAVGAGASATGPREQRMLYGDPRSDGEQLGVVAEGTQLLLLEGPRSAQGGQWWSVRLPDGRSGWLPVAALGPDPFPGKGNEGEVRGAG